MDFAPLSGIRVVDLTTVVRHVLDELQQPEEHRGV